MLNRRRFIKLAGLTSASIPLWLHSASLRAMSQLGGSYRAIVVITLPGGNDGNNVLIPLDNTRYRQYASLRGSLAIPQAACIPLVAAGSTPSYGLHPSLTHIAGLYNQKKALFVANVGPLGQPATKAQMRASSLLVPEALLSHPGGTAQWESASTVAEPSTGWGGRMADLLVSQSGSLPPVLDAGSPSIFTVGRSVQGIAVQAATSTALSLPPGINDAISALAAVDRDSHNLLVSQAGSLRMQALQQQALLSRAQTSGAALKTMFPNTSFGQEMKTIASVISGRAITEASRQIFYTQQGLYDTHGEQLGQHVALLTELDNGLGAFMSALEEMGLTNQVLVCTHSDFNRTMLVNKSAGSDHAWGNHQLVLGGGINGGQVLGTFPDLDIGGAMDWDQTGLGTWIPSTSVTEMTAGIGAWMGLSSSELMTVFPDLSKFPSGPLLFT